MYIILSHGVLLLGAPSRYAIPSNDPGVSRKAISSAVGSSPAPCSVVKNVLICVVFHVHLWIVHMHPLILPVAAHRARTFGLVSTTVVVGAVVPYTANQMIPSEQQSIPGECASRDTMGEQRVPIML